MAVPSTSSELTTQKNLRAFFQPGSAGPDNKPLFAGQDMEYLRIEGLDAPVLGDVKPMFVHDPNSVGSYKAVAAMISPPDFAKADLVLSEKRGYVPRQFLRPKCQYNVYEMVGECKDMSDFNGGWSDYIAVYPGGVLTGRNFGDRMTWEDDKANEAKLGSVFSREFYAIGPLGFGSVGSTAALGTGKLVNDVVYYGGAQCSNCGVDNDGTKWQAAVNTGGAASKPDLLYSTDGGATWTAVNLTAAVNAEALNGVFWTGSKLVAMSKTAGTTVGGFYIFDVNPYTGVPTYNTKVTTGFVASSAANDVLVLSPTEMYFCGDGGYIYKSTDVFAGVTVLNAGAATTNNLNRIDGSREVIVAVGASSTLIYSTNRGQSFIPPTATPVAAAYQAISVNGRDLWWVGTDGGQVFYTKNHGETWVEKVIETNAKIWDIVFVTAEVGYILAATSTPAGRIYATNNGGYNWTRTTARVGNIPTNTKMSRIAIPTAADPTTAVNTLLIGGTAANGTDGSLYAGASNFI